MTRGWDPQRAGTGVADLFLHLRRRYRAVALTFLPAGTLAAATSGARARLAG